MKQIPMRRAGGAVDTDVLTATKAHVREGDIFYGSGSDDPQTGELPDMSKAKSSPSTKDGGVPLHWADDVYVGLDSEGVKRIGMIPPRGEYPGSGAMVGSTPEAVGIVPQKIASGQNIAGIDGSYGADSTGSADDLRSGKVLYGKNGAVIGSADDNGSVSTTLAAGESYTIKKGFYLAGKVTAKDLASQTAGTIDAASIIKGFVGWSNGKKIIGTMENYPDAVYNASDTVLDGSYLKMKIPNTGRYFSGNFLRSSLANIRNAIGFTADMLRSDKKLLGISGTAKYADYYGRTIFDGNLDFNTSGTIEYEGDGQTYHVKGGTLIDTHAFGGYMLLQIGIIENGYTYDAFPVWYPAGTYSARIFALRIPPYYNNPYVSLVVTRNQQGQVYIRGIIGSTSGTHRVKVVHVLDCNQTCTVWD